MTTTPDQMCTCGHGAASAHDIDNSVPAFTACVVTGCTCKAFTERPAVTALTASDVLVQHDVTRKAMCDSLDVGWHLNWQQIIDTAQRSHNANAAWQAEAEDRRKALAEALDVHASRGWANLINTAEDVRRGRRAAGLRAHEAEQEAARARRGEAEAVRARKAAERFAETSGTLAFRANEHARRYRDAWQSARKRAALMTAEVTRRAPLNGEYAEAARRAMEQRQEMAEERFAWQERGDRAEGKLTAAREIAARLAAHAVGFQDVLDESDRGPWGKTIGADLADLQAALGDPQPATPFACATPGGTCRRPADCAHGCQVAADLVTRLGQEIGAEPDDADRIVAYRNVVQRGSLLCRDHGKGLQGSVPLASDDLPDGGICTACGADVLAEPTEREQPTGPLLRGPVPEVHVNVTPAQVRDAVRHIIRENRAQLRDWLR